MIFFLTKLEMVIPGALGELGWNDPAEQRAAVAKLANGVSRDV